MNRRSILSLLSMAPLVAVAACAPRQRVRAPIDGLMKDSHYTPAYHDDGGKRRMAVVTEYSDDMRQWGPAPARYVRYRVDGWRITA